jgi:hypothetical protein
MMMQIYQKKNDDENNSLRNAEHSRASSSYRRDN